MKQEPPNRPISASIRSGYHAANRYVFSIVMMVIAGMSLDASAADLHVSMMPSYNQSLTYANAAINEPVQVWGRASGGSGTYTNYTLDFGDGTPVASGVVNNGLTSFQVGGPDFIQANHAYTSGGSKTVTLTVMDSSGASASRSSVIRVLVAPTHSDRVNMAIDNGLIYLYRQQVRYGTPVRSYWTANGDEYGNGATGAALMSFAENGHLVTNDPVADVYAETVQRGIYQAVSLGRNQAISNQPAGNPDTNGNGRGINFSPNYVVYDHSFLLMSIINAFPDAASATAATIPAGLWSGGGATPANFYDFVVDGLDCYYWCQTDNSAGRNGWYYNSNTANTGNLDGSTHQWPGIAMLTAKERWGIVPPAWVVSNSTAAFVGLQHLSIGDPLDGSVGYSSNTHWRNSGKTGGALMGFYLGGKLVGPDDNANRARDFIARNWYATGTTGSGADLGGWDGELYAMFGQKKGLQLQGVTTFVTPDGAVHDWYQDMSAWLLGNATLLDSSLPVAQGPTIPATIDSLTFEILNTCYSTNYEFFLNGVSLGAVAGNPSGSCTCGAPLTTFTVTNPALLANWHAGASNNTLSFINPGYTLVAWVRAKITSGGTTTKAYLYDSPGGNLDDLNLCNAGYQGLSSFSGSNSDLFAPAGTVKVGAGRRTSSRAFGQAADGSWTTTEWPITGSIPLATAHAVLVLTKSVTIPLPVAVIAGVPDQSSRNPGAFALDGSGSYHQSPNSTIVEYLWDLDASDGLDWNNPGASGRITSANPGWNTPGNRTVTLRVKDDAATPNYSTATTVVKVTDTDVAPVAVPIPASQLPPVYTGTIGGTIYLNGIESFDVDGDPITAYAWDLDGNGTFGDSADAAKDTSGNGAHGVTASLIYTAAYNGQVGLRVTSTPPNGIPKSSNNNTLIDVQASPSDLSIASIVTSDLVVGSRTDLDIVFQSALGSGSDASNVVVRFYDGNPLTTGNIIGSSVTLSIPRGSSVPLHINDLPLVSGQTLVWVYVDSGRVFAEYDETNNTTSVNVSNKAPVAIAQNVTVVADGEHCEGVVSADQVNNGSSDPDGDALTLTLTPTGPYPLGDTPVTLTVSDGKLSSTASAVVTVVDRTPPTLAGQGADGTIECPDVPVFTAPTATDHCDLAPVVSEVSDVSTPGTCPGSYTRTKTWKAKDASNNESAIVSQTIAVVDISAPTLSGQGADATLECPQAPVFTAPVASDHCDPNPTVTEISDVTVDGVCHGTYTRTKTWRATDCAGNASAPVTQAITIADTTPPTLAGQGADATIECPATPVFTAPVGSDLCDAAPLVSVVSDVTTPGACAGVYRRTITWKATDCSGLESATVSQTVTVTDSTIPTLSGQGADATIECPAVPVFTAPVASDLCDADPVVSVVSDITTPGACAGTYSRTITWKATDCSQLASATVSQTISVVDTTAPVITGQGADATIEAPASPVFTAPVARDLCDADPVVTETGDVTVPSACPGIYTRTKTWTATDCTGNHASVSQKITVVDTTAPVLAGQGANATLECPAAPVFQAPGALDHCDANPTVTVVSDVTVPGDCAGVYKRTMTWKATDCAGNVSATVSQEISVLDTTVPTLAGQGANTIIECPATPVFKAPMAADNCDANPVVSVVSDVTTPGVCAGVYSRTITWKATDCEGLVSSTVSQTIRVVDTTKPVITCPVNVLVVSGAGSCDATNVQIGAATATDTCCPPAVSNNHPSTTYHLGETLVTWTAVDDSGNAAVCVQKVTVISSVGITFLPPLAGQPVGNKLKRGQVIPHKVQLKNCDGGNVGAGVTVKLKVLGIDSATGSIFQDVVEDANGSGTDGTLQSDGLMQLNGPHWQFNLDTSNFIDAQTIVGSRHYLSTVTVIDNATLKVLGSGSVILETAK